MKSNLETYLRCVLKVNLPGVIIIDAPSGFGKTSILKKLRDTKSLNMQIYSTEKIVLEYLEHYRKYGDAIPFYKNPIFHKSDVFVIEDIDLLKDKQISLSILAETINELKNIRFILTGINLQNRMKKFLEQLYKTIIIIGE